jgi:hypothetical protein
MKFLESDVPARRGHTGKELASRPDCFPYELRRSDGCNLLKTKLESASSSKGVGDLRLLAGARGRGPRGLKNT